MLSKIKNFGKRVKAYMNDKVEQVRNILSNNTNRKILGVIIIGSGLGIGGGLLISGYITE